MSTTSTSITPEEAPATTTTTAAPAPAEQKPAKPAKQAPQPKQPKAPKEPKEKTASATTTTTEKPTKENAKKRKEQTGRGGMIITDPVAGTRDFPPAQMRMRKWLFNKFHDVAKVFGFEEYDAPILEPEELYKRKAGEDITKQMYNFVDKSELPVALRPEMTPTLARLILQQERSLLLPVKWYSIPQCWRFENMTRGRKREHYQWNMDIWGIEGPAAEAELLAAIVQFFKSVGLTEKDVGIKVSSRKVIQSILESLGVTAEKFAPACVIVDKLDKLEKAQVIKEMGEIEVDAETTEKIIESLAVKTVEELAAKLGEKHPAVVELKLLFEYAKGYGFGDYLIFDATIVRGLAYYTGIVFEAFAMQGELKRAVCGGGRYDKILSTYGSKKDIPACGFGFGDCVIMEILADKGLLPSLPQEVQDIVFPFSEDFRPQSCGIVTTLRLAGRTAAIVMKKSKVHQAFSYADRVGALRMIFVAPDEWARGIVRVKYLREGTGIEGDKSNEYEVPVAELTTWQKPAKQ